MGAKISNLFNRVWTFIDKDVENANETKKASVIMRLYTLIMCAYFVCQTVLLVMYGNYIIALAGVLFFFIYLLGFAVTYMNETRIALNYAEFTTIIWIILYIYLLGWDCGVQHFLFVLLAFICVTSHRGAIYKGIIAASLCIFRIILYAWCKLNIPVMVLETSAGVAYQIINTIAIFGELTMIMIFFSQDSIAMEKKLMDYNEEVRYMASVDPLTKLYNRRAIMGYINDLTNEKRSEKKWFSIAIGDIDFFKKVNDTYGHDAGDEVLKMIADILAVTMEGKGRAARWGGEEFLLIFENANGDEAFIELENLRMKLQRKKIKYGDKDISITMTFGVEEYDFGRDVEMTINSADKKLYMGKSSGRNKVVY